MEVSEKNMHKNQNLSQNIVFVSCRFFQYIVNLRYMNWLENLPERFVRTYDHPFDVAEFCKIMHSAGVSFDKISASDFLFHNPLLFSLTNGKFVTKASVFNGYLFSFKPTREEINAGAFFVGHRCVPVADFEKMPQDLTFAFRSHKLHQVVRTFKSDFILEHFSLFGEEYALQYVASDPACQTLDLTNPDFVLPTNLSITCFSLEPLLKEGLKFGDSLILRIIDWNEGIIAIDIRPDEKQHPFDNESHETAFWYKTLEEGLLSSFDRLGPGTSIEEQLSNVFFEKRAVLDSFFCGSAEEFIQRSEKVAFEYFGVETRLWRSGESVPAVGEWNYCGSEDITEDGFVILPSFVFDCFILDEVLGDGKDINELPKQIYPKTFTFKGSELKAVQKELKARCAVLKKQYNSFADYDIKPIRHRTLQLYKEVSSLMYEIDTLGTDLKKMPQQEMVILSQLYAHVISLLQVMAIPGELDEDLDTLEMSIDGMEFNFEDIVGVLTDAVARQRNNGYVIIQSNISHI